MDVDEGLAEVTTTKSCGVRSGVRPRSSRAGIFLAPNEPALLRTGMSSGVTGIGRLAVEDVDGVLNPTSSPSRMCPSDVSKPRRLEEVAGAER